MPLIHVDEEKGNEVCVSYADYGEGQPVILIHGWPLSHRMWESQIAYLVEAGYRVIAYDRRGFGESFKPWSGYDYDTLAADLSEIIEQLDLNHVLLVGFSMGGGEVARYVAKYGSQRIAKVVLLSAVTPYLLKTDDNPEGVDKSVFDEIEKGLTTDRPGFLETFTMGFVNWKDGERNPISEAQLKHAWDIGVWANPRATIAAMHSFSQTDFRDDLEALKDLPVLIIHGNNDQTVPFEASGKRTHQALPDSQLVIVEGGAHGLTMTQPDDVNRLLLKFFKE